jgi:hypothetical protein
MNVRVFGRRGDRGDSPHRGLYARIWCARSAGRIAIPFAAVVLAALLLIGREAIGTTTCDKAKVYLPEVVSLEGSHDFLDWMSDAGTLLLVSRASFDFSRSEIFEISFDGVKWHEKILDISTGPYDSGIALSPNRTHAMFSSTRESSHSESGAWNVWRSSAVHSEDGFVFGAPQIMPWPINSEGNDCCAVFGRSGDLYFASDRDGKWSIYHASYSSGDVDVHILAGDVNRSDGGAWPSFFDRSRNILIFSSIRADGVGGDDLFFAKQTGADWQLLRPSTDTVNKPGYEDSGRIFGQHFYWSSRSSEPDDQPNKELSSVYVIDARCVVDQTEN